MPKRVSVRGKGADLFFGGGPAGEKEVEQPDAAKSEPVPPPLPASEDTPRNSGQSSQTNTPKQARARKLPIQTTSAQPDEQSTTEQNEPQIVAIDNNYSYHASKLASMIAEQKPEFIEAIRKAVKAPGKEVSFVRLTASEKQQLASIVYAYKQQGKKTSENEINRIAINYILADYKAHGAESVLAKVIEALLA